MFYVASEKKLDLQYCTFENANLSGTWSAGSIVNINDWNDSSQVNITDCIIKDNKGTAINLIAPGLYNIKNCKFLRNSSINTEIDAAAIYVKNDDIEVNIENCEFSESELSDVNDVYVSDISIEEANKVTLNSCKFDSYDFSGSTKVYNVYIYKSNTLILDGNIQLPKLYFDNQYGDSNLQISIENNFNSSNLIEIGLSSFTSTKCLWNSSVDYSDKFVLSDESYKLNTNGSISSI